MGLFKAKSVPARAGPVPTWQLLGLRGSPGCHSSGGAVGSSSYGRDVHRRHFLGDGKSVGQRWQHPVYTVDIWRRDGPVPDAGCGTGSSRHLL